MSLKLVAAFIITLSLVLLGCGKEEDKLVINYCKALEDGDIEKISSYQSKFAREEYEKVGGRAALAAETDAIKKHKGIKKIKISERKENGPLAAIRFVYKFNDGSDGEGFYNLIREDGKWKISK